MTGIDTSSPSITSFRLDNSTSVPVYIPNSEWGDVSSGVSGYSGSTPDLSSGGASLHLGLVIDTLATMLPTMSSQDAQAAVTFALNLLQQQESNNTVATETEQQQMQQTMMQVAAQLAQQAQTEQQQAQSDTNGVNIWDDVKAALQIFASLVSVAVGIALLVSGVGTAAGLLMIASGVTGLLGGVNSVLQTTTGLGIGGNIAKDNGDSQSQIAQADIGFSVSIAVVGLALAVAGFLAGGGNEISEAAELAEIITTGINADTAIASGLGDGVSAYFTYQATTDKATAQSLSAEQQQVQGSIDQITAAIKAISQQASEDFKAIAAAFANEMQLVGQTGTTLASVKFAG